jgi:hypothetical protein
MNADWWSEERNTELKGKQVRWGSGLYDNRDHRGRLYLFLNITMKV